MDRTGNLNLWPPRTVVYGTDFSKSAERAGEYASLLARQYEAELVVVHAFTLSQFAMEVEAETGTGSKSVQRKDLEGALASAARRFGAGVKRVCPVLVEGDPEERIPELAREKPPSIIVLGTRGRGRLGRSIIGSAADGILRSADGPSLTVGPQAPELVEGVQPFKKVLYASDLSPAAALGAVYAAGIAEDFGASLDALHVVDASDMKDPERLAQIRREFHSALEGAALRLAGDLVEPKEWIEEGTARTQILEHARAHKVDLVVLSVQKSSHLWLRERVSTAFQIIAEAPCPVMTIMG